MDYNATVTFDTRADVDDDIVDALAGYGPATDRDVRRHAQVHITFDAASLEQASVVALGLAARTNLPVLGLEVLPTTEFDARVTAMPTSSGDVSVTEAAERLHLSRQAVLHRIKTGALPATKVGRTYSIPAGAVEAATAALTR